MGTGGRVDGLSVGCCFLIRGHPATSPISLNGSHLLGVVFIGLSLVLKRLYSVMMLPPCLVYGGG